MKFFKVIKSIFMVAILMVTSLYVPGNADALSGAEFNPGRIIDDSVFFNSNSMSVGEIQNFLNNKVDCDFDGSEMTGGITRAQYAAQRGYPTTFTCLPQYKENPQTKENNIGSPNYTPSGGLSSAQILYNASAEWGVSSKALIVLLQKEQGLVTDEWPVPRQYQIATGYGCPDTAPCDAQYYGFYNQVNKAAYQFKRYVANSASYRYKAGQVNSIYWSPTTSCGASDVYIENGATAALYNYTPYRPNQAALNNLYGTGDGCSAYGNRNFWRYFRDWFGVSTGYDTNSPHPDGALVNLDNKIYRIEGSRLRYITSPEVFYSYNYRWSDVRRATIGDRELTVGEPLNFIWQGPLYQIPGDTSVYYTAYESGQWKKKHISYYSFTNLGYGSSDVRVVSEPDTPSATSSNLLETLTHPNGTLIDDGGSVYLLDSGTRRYVSYPIFISHNFNWSQVKKATSQDKALPLGYRLLFEEGSIISKNGDLYSVDLLSTGDEVGLHIGPWECFSDRLSYNATDIITYNPIVFSSVKVYSCS